MKSGSYPDGLIKKQKRRFKSKTSYFSFVSDILCFKKEYGRLLSIVLDFEIDLKQLILNEHYQPGHLGISKIKDFFHRKNY